MHVRLRNEQTGNLKEVKIGFSWTLLLFSSFFGIPLFMRKLYQWAYPTLFFTLTEIPNLFSDAEIYGVIANVGALMGFACAIYLGIEGNELTARNLLKNGWEFADENDQATDFAKMKWSLA